MAQPFSGSLLRNSAANYTTADNAKNWGVGVDPDHQRSDLPDPGYPAPVPYLYREVDPAIQDMFDPASEPPYIPEIDNEPAPYDDQNQHSVPTLPWGVKDTDSLRQLSGQLHSVNKGAMRAYTATKIGRDWTTQNESRREQSLPGNSDQAVPGQSTRALRGRNSLPLNNPGNPDTSFSGNYVRQGWNLDRITNRRMDRHSWTPVKRELHVNVAQTAVDTPPHPGPYSSPFRNFGDFSKGAWRPFQRREPRQWDETSVSDGSEYGVSDDQAQYTSWGL